MTFDKIKMKIGLETLTLVSQIENIIHEKNTDNPKGLLRILDLVGRYHDTRILELKHTLQLKKVIFGKKFIRDCCKYTIKCHKECDIDLILILQKMHISTKKLVNKNQK